MSLYIVTSPDACLPRGTYVYRYDQGYIRADMRPTKRGNLHYWGDLDQVLIPAIALDLFVTEIAHKGGGDYYWKNGEVHRKTIIIT